MHASPSGLAALLLVALALPHLHAELAGPPATEPPTTALPAPPEPETPLAAAMREQLASSTERSKSDVERALERHRRGLRRAPIRPALDQRGRAVAQGRSRDRRDWSLPGNGASTPPPSLRRGRQPTPDAMAAADLQLSRAVVAYAVHARGGRVDPSQLSLWLDQRPRPVDIDQLLPAIAEADEPDAALRRLHPQHAGFERLREAYLAARAPPSRAA